jgi:hypothetical protein
MHLGALVALAEVGIGFNLAFTVVRQFRDWLRTELLAYTKAACGKMEAGLAEFKAKGQSLSVQQAIAYDRWFETSTARISTISGGAALVAGVALMMFLYYVADHADDLCAHMWRNIVSAGALAPIVLSWLLIALLYAGVRVRLALVLWKHGQLLVLWKSVDLPIQPTDPDNGSNPPKPDK